MPDPAESRIEAWFLVPLVRNSDRNLHPPHVWQCLMREIVELAGGVSEETVKAIQGIETVRGGWVDTVSGRFVKDESRKYTLVIPADRVEDLRKLARRVANSFDQEEVLLMVKGGDRSVRRDPAFGLLKGHLTIDE